uniref:Tropomyosin n=1 Tax=Parascaris equorum TaxID=6256 RepID=A0A914SAJ1_PAREQ
AHLLEKELEDAKNEIDELKKTLNRIDQENREKIELTLMTKTAPDEKSKEREITSTYESTHIHEIRDELERRVRLLEDELTEKQRNLDRQEAGIEDLRREHKYNSALKDLQKLADELDTARANYEKVIFVSLLLLLRFLEGD